MTRSTSTSQDRSRTMQPLAVSAEDLFNRFQAALRDGDTERMLETLAPDFVCTMGDFVNGTREDAITYFLQWLNAFSDYGQQQGILTGALSPDRTQFFVRDSNTMTHTGNFPMCDGVIIPASHRRVTVYTTTQVLAGPKGIRKIDAAIHNELRLFLALGGMVAPEFRIASGSTERPPQTDKSPGSAQRRSDR